MACPFCALGLQHFAKSSDVERQFRQRSRSVHPDKLNTPDPECFQFKMLQSTKDLALLYTAAQDMPFVCQGLALAIPAPVPNVNPNVNLNPLLTSPVLIATQWPTRPRSSGDSPAQQVHFDPRASPYPASAAASAQQVHFDPRASPYPAPAAASKWPTADQCAGNSAEQQCHPADSQLPWNKMRWRWFGKCLVDGCPVTEGSEYGYGGAPQRLKGWSRHHNLCPNHNVWPPK
jgi:hypothetical protein